MAYYTDPDGQQVHFQADIDDVYTAIQRLAKATEERLAIEQAAFTWTQGMYQQQKRTADALERIADSLEQR
ncbi:hypothetical protein [Cellulosimicrobium funkei]|nr:hypothetical protein [Cellulosimicrobium funkei]